MLLTFKTTLQLNSGCGGQGKKDTDPASLRPQNDVYPQLRPRSKVRMGAAEHNAQFFKCSETVTTPFVETVRDSMLLGEREGIRVI